LTADTPLTDGYVAQGPKLLHTLLRFRNHEVVLDDLATSRYEVHCEHHLFFVDLLRDHVPCTLAGNQREPEPPGWSWMKLELDEGQELYM
jgi:hypothetical protein